MTLNNKKKIATSGFHSIRISHDAFVLVKEKNFKEFKEGNASHIGETASKMILAGASR